jgi:tetratricopeptide (TPR) repeat protein
MMNKTTTSVYRIFLSSTAIDMVEHRKKVIDTILRMGDMPVAMETFGALPNEPVEVCKKKVRESNALVVMVAHRYGWVPEPDEGGDGFKSITWIEVETALNESIPVFAFLVDMNYGWTQPKEQDLLLQAKEKEDVEKVVQYVKALKDFREFLENKAGLVRETFTTPEDLALKVSTSLSNWAREPKLTPGSVPIKRTWVFREVHPLQPAPHFRGRQDLLKDLQRWWQDPVHPDRVRSLVAIGGTGKTVVIQRFLIGIREDRLRGSILVWSFYEDPDTDAFLREACTVFAGEEGEGAGGRLERLQRALSGNEPHLLVLDGLERVQSIGKAGRARGDLEDHHLKNLLRSIASGLGRTRALITSRFKLTDLEQWENAGYSGTHLEVLDEQAAVEVLRAWKVRGDENQLLALAQSVGRHALSVSVLGSYLAHFCHGDTKGAEEFNLEEVSVDESQAAKLGRILAGYAENLPNEERDLLVRLSVFPRGVTVDILGYLVDAGGEIAGALVGIQQAKLIRLAERLHHQGLVYTYKRQDLLTYTAHPFLREYFRDLLGVPPGKIHEAVRSKLAVGLDSKPKTKPREPEMLDRYEALIEHSILAGHVQEAFDLFDNAMGGEPQSSHIYHTLCDYGRIIRIASLFATDGQPWHLAPQLSIRDRSYLIGYWGVAAHALGDLSTAGRCFDAASELVRMNNDKENLSQGLQFCAWVIMFRGTFPSAQKLLKESLEYAEEDFEYIRRYSHGFLAATCHALGKIPEAKENFTKAADIAGKPLYSTDGIYEAEHLLALGNKTKAYKRTGENLAQCERYEFPRDIAICHTLLGLFSLPGSISKARNHLKKAREWTNQSGCMEVILRAHILAAEIAYCSGDFPAALAEATTGLNQAEGCGFGWFAIELLLQLAKIHLAIPDARAALQYARQALDRSEHPDCCYAWGEANALHLCGICHKELKEPELARKRLKAALKIRKRIQHPGAGETEKILEEL